MRPNVTVPDDWLEQLYPPLPAERRGAEALKLFKVTRKTIWQWHRTRKMPLHAARTLRRALNKPVPDRVLIRDALVVNYWLASYLRDELGQRPASLLAHNEDPRLSLARDAFGVMMAAAKSALELTGYAMSETIPADVLEKVKEMIDAHGFRGQNATGTYDQTAIMGALPSLHLLTEVLDAQPAATFDWQGIARSSGASSSGPGFNLDTLKMKKPTSAAGSTHPPENAK